jgi:hypothetical protein
MKAEVFLSKEEKRRKASEVGGVSKAERLNRYYILKHFYKSQCEAFQMIIIQFSW